MRLLSALLLFAWIVPGSARASVLFQSKYQDYKLSGAEITASNNTVLFASPRGSSFFETLDSPEEAQALRRFLAQEADHRGEGPVEGTYYIVIAYKKNGTFKCRVLKRGKEGEAVSSAEHSLKSLAKRLVNGAEPASNEPIAGEPKTKPLPPAAVFSGRSAGGEIHYAAPVEPGAPVVGAKK